jgi:hypothetical protein
MIMPVPRVPGEAGHSAEPTPTSTSVKISVSQLTLHHILSIEYLS